MIPLLFILGLLVLFVVNAWPVGALTSVVIVALLLGIAVGLIRTTMRLA